MNYGKYRLCYSNELKEGFLLELLNFVVPFFMKILNVAFLPFIGLASILITTS